MRSFTSARPGVNSPCSMRFANKQCQWDYLTIDYLTNWINQFGDVLSFNEIIVERFNSLLNSFASIIDGHIWRKGFLIISLFSEFNLNTHLQNIPNANTLQLIDFIQLVGMLKRYINLTWRLEKNSPLCHFHLYDDINLVWATASHLKFRLTRNSQFIFTFPNNYNEWVKITFYQWRHT